MHFAAPSSSRQLRMKGEEKNGIKETFFFPFILISAVDVISFIPFIFHVPKKDSHDLRMKCKIKKKYEKEETRMKCKHLLEPHSQIVWM